MRLRLRDPLGVFYDPETGLRLRMTNEVDVSSIEGRLTKDWVNSGGIIIVKEEVSRKGFTGSAVVTADDPAKEGGELPVLVVPPPPSIPEAPKVKSRRPRRSQRRM